MRARVGPGLQERPNSSLVPGAGVRPGPGFQPHFTRRPRHVLRMAAMVASPLRRGSLIWSQIAPSDLPSQAMDSGARCQCGSPDTRGSKLAAPWQVLQASRRRAMAVLAAHHQRLVRTHAVGLGRAVARGMTVDAARMLQNLARLLEQRDRARAAHRRCL